MACNFPYKKDNRKRLFLLHIELDSYNIADNTVQYINDISAIAGSISLWIFGIFSHYEHEKKNRINQIYDTFAMHLW